MLSDSMMEVKAAKQKLHSLRIYLLCVGVFITCTSEGTCMISPLTFMYDISRVADFDWYVVNRVWSESTISIFRSFLVIKTQFIIAGFHNTTQHCAHVTENQTWKSNYNHTHHQLSLCRYSCCSSYTVVFHKPLLHPLVGSKSAFHIAVTPHSQLWWAWYFSLGSDEVVNIKLYMQTFMF